MDITIALIIVVIATVIIFNLNSVIPLIKVTVSRNDYFNRHFKYQTLLLALASIVLLLTYFQAPSSFIQLMSVGNITARVEPVVWLGIGEQYSWLSLGIYLGLIITLGTAIFVFLQFRHLKISVVEVYPYIGWILLFSLINSFSEEAIFRVGIVAPLINIIDGSYIVILSAVIFGLAHSRGMPNGLVGMLMAGFLGWFLAKSVLETYGIFWAWTIHFIQDVIIYCGLVVYQLSKKQFMK